MIETELQADADAGDVEDDVAIAPQPPDADEDPSLEAHCPEPVDELAVIEAAEAVTSRMETSGDTDRGRIMTDDGTPVTGRAPDSTTASEADPPPDGCG